MTDFDELPTYDDEPQPSGSNNRTFIIAVAVLGGIFLLVLVVMAVFALLVLPNRRAEREGQVATINAQNTATVIAVTQQALALMVQTQEATKFAPTPVPPTATATAKPTNTPVVAVATDTPEPPPENLDPRTATVVALLTQAAEAQTTQTAMPTSTALPNTGFGDEIGIPGLGLIGLTVVLLVVIFLVRRMRSNPLGG